MKKYFLLLVVAIFAMFSSSCHKDKKGDAAVDSTLCVDTLIKSDFAMVVAAQTDSTVEPKFFESEINLAKSVADTDSVANKAIVVRNIIQAGDTCWEITHFTTKTTVEKFNNYWCEDIAINLDSVKVGLDSALICLAKADVVKPNTKCVTLRQPLCAKPSKYALYIFGNQNRGIVEIDAHSGKLVK